MNIAERIFIICQLFFSFFFFFFFSPRPLPFNYFRLIESFVRNQLLSLSLSLSRDHESFRFNEITKYVKNLEEGKKENCDDRKIDMRLRFFPRFPFPSLLFVFFFLSLYEISLIGSNLSNEFREKELLEFEQREGREKKIKKLEKHFI